MTSLLIILDVNNEKIKEYFWPFDKFKNCDVKDRVEQILNFKHNQKQKFLLFETAMNYFILSGLSLLLLLFIEKIIGFLLPIFLISCFGLICGTITSLATTIGIYCLVLFILLNKK